MQILLYIHLGLYASKIFIVGRDSEYVSQIKKWPITIVGYEDENGGVGVGDVRDEVGEGEFEA